MEWKRILIAAGGAGAFGVFVASGAFVIVSLAPGDRPAGGTETALLMETSPALRSFDEPQKPRAAQSGPAVQARLAEPAAPPLSAPRPVPPSQEELLSQWTNEPATPETAPSSAAPSLAAPSSAPAGPAAPVPHKEPREFALAVPPVVRQPALPAPALKPPERRVDGLVTPGEIRRMRLSLRLTPEQAPLWVPVEQALLEIGAQQAAMVRAGQDPKDAFGVGAAMRMYSVARPLLNVLRDDQKAQVRERARAMGFGSVASSI